jgi:hypothetical protein
VQVLTKKNTKKKKRNTGENTGGKIQTHVAVASKRREA